MSSQDGPHARSSAAPELSDGGGRASASAETPESASASPRAGEERSVSGPAGLAYVGALSFLASRASPSGGFWLALAGGVALARAGARFGARLGYGASIAATVQTVAYLGPARLNAPLTQAITAPMMGALDRRGVGALGQFLACSAGRILHNTLATAFFIWVILGGLDAYAGTYDELLGSLPLFPKGAEGALLFTAASMVAWTVAASSVQVHVYRRGLARWTADVSASERTSADEARASRARRFDPRAVSVAAAIGFGILLASTEWLVLGAVAAWLGAAWLASRPDREAVPAGLVLTLLLAGGSLIFSLTGGLGVEVALRRASRAALLVLVATWLRAAAGSDGVREVARRTLGRLRGIPTTREAGAILDELGTGGRLAPPARALGAALSAARKRPLALVDAVLGWVVQESNRMRIGGARPPARLRLRPADGLLVLIATAPCALLLAAVPSPT